MTKIREDLIGKVYGQLTVKNRIDDYITPNGQHYSMWLCECDCDEHNLVEVRGTSLKNGSIISCKSCSIKRTANAHRKTSLEYVLEVSDKYPNISVLEDYKGCDTKILHGCKICGFEWKNTPRKILSGVGCQVCRGNIIGPAPEYKNSIWASEYKDLFIKYLTEEQMKNIMPNSSIKTDMICPDCGRHKNITPNQVVRLHSISCVCSDNISYPNKFLYEMLNQLGVSYQSEKQFAWSEKKRYDIYIDKFNLIIENHGIQHYENIVFTSNKNKCTFKEEQENDRLKYNLAIKNGIGTYVVLDCRKSDTNWIKNSITNSILGNMFDLSLINWEKCDEFACSNMVKAAADLWNNGLSTSEIATELCIGHSTVIQYLKIARKSNMCDYTAELSHKRGGAKISGSKSYNAKCVIQLSLEGEFIKEWNCINDAARELGISTSGIVNCCKHNRNRNSAGGFKWIYKEEYLTIQNN